MKFRDNDGGGPYTVKLPKATKATKERTKQTMDRFNKREAIVKEKMKEPGMTWEKAYNHASTVMDREPQKHLERK